MSFTLDLKAFADKTDATVNAVVRKIVLDVGGKLVLKSPVGDGKFWKSPPPPGYVGGRFRANWQYGLSHINGATTLGVNNGKLASTEAAAASIGLVGKVAHDAAGKVHYLTNSLPYAQRLEEGWSYRQAPHGMVALTVLEFEPIVAEAARALAR